MAKKLKEEKTRIKIKKKEQMAQMCSASGVPLPEVEHLVEKVDEYEIDDQIVTISALDSYDAAREAGLCLGPNKSSNPKGKKRKRESTS